MESLCMEICGNKNWRETPLFMEYLKHLQKEEYIHVVHSYYAATIKGLIFEGYVQQKQDKTNLRQYKKNYEERIEGIASRTEQSAESLTTRTKNLANYTIWLAIATGLLVLVEILTKWN